MPIKDLFPLEVVRLARGTDAAGFKSIYGNSPVLVVKLRADSAELAQGLSLTVPSAMDSGRFDAPREETVFVTSYEEPTAPRMAPMSGTEPAPSTDLSTHLTACSNFLVPIRKRPKAEGLFADRVSVGRARNKDIVLRDASVSKFHGWFMTDDRGSLTFSDAGSTNSTFVNRIKVVSREPVALRGGDILRVGTVEAVLTTTDAIWQVLSRT